MSSPLDENRQSIREAIRAFAEPKMAMMLVLGFTAGLPFLLYFSTLSVWLERSEVDVAIIGFFSFFGLAYSFKFLWAPILDRFDVPGLSSIFGRRRAWILVAQLGVAAALVGIGLADPTENLMVTALFSFILAFFSSTQDIGIDGWRIEAADNDDEQAPLAAAYQYGYKVGMIISGGVALVIAGVANFNAAYISMAAIMVLAALVFAVWDSRHGTRTAAFAGLALLLVGLFTAFGQFGTQFIEGSFARTLLGGLEALVQVFTAMAAIGFLIYFVRALLDRSTDRSISLSAVTKGLLATALIVTGVITLASIVGLGVSAAVDALGLQDTKRSTIQQLAVYVALTPIIIAAMFVPIIRKQPADSRHLKHPAYGAFADFFWRHGQIAVLILCFVSFYRLSDIVMGIMAKPAYSAMGYSPEEIGLVSGIFGVWVVFIGVAAAGLSAIRLGLKLSLIIGAVVSVIGNVTFAWLVNQSSESLVPLFVAITADNIAGGYAGTIFIAYMSTFVNKSFAGTQYAIFSSIYSLGPKIVAGTSGTIVKSFSGGEDATIAGYSSFFLFAAALGLPAILLSLFVDKMKADRQAPDLKSVENAKGQPAAFNPS
ncbi:MAG: MFS transporter [Pseudomonadota bacterium]